MYSLTLDLTKTEDTENLKDPQRRQYEASYKRSTFPAGEVYFRITFPMAVGDRPVKIIANPKSSHDVMEILMANDALRNLGASDISLELQYTPYARQDRVVYHGESFSFRVFASMINSCNFKKVTVYDPHSYVTPALINNCHIDNNKLNEFRFRVFNQLSSVSKVLTDNEWTLIAPDAGAEKKVYDVLNDIELYNDLPDKNKSAMAGIGDRMSNIISSPTHIATGTKHRNKDGSMSLAINDGGQQIAKTAVIVDDICDGGRTFIEVAKVLREQHNVEKIILIVTVGIFSKGLDVFDGYIDEIYCMNRLNDNKKHHQKVNILLQQ